MSTIRSVSIAKCQLTSNNEPTRSESSPMEFSKSEENISKPTENLFVQEKEKTIPQEEEVLNEENATITITSEEKQISSEILEKENIDAQITESLPSDKLIEEEPAEVCMVEQNENKSEEVFKLPEFPILDEQQIAQEESNTTELAQVEEKSQEFAPIIEESSIKELNTDVNIEVPKNDLESAPSNETETPPSTISEILMMNVE